MSETQDFDLIIEPTRGFQNYWRDLWRYRELFLFMAWRDILVRYKQTVLGLAWSILRPLLILIVFTVLFGKLARFPSEGSAPYPVLVLAALLPWQLFANALSESSNSLILNANMISKVYFPRLIIPASAVIVSCVDFLIAFSLLAGVMAWYQYLPSLRILFLPGFMLLAILTALGGGLWMSALNVKYRDFRYIIPFMVQFGLYVSPVGFSSSVIPEQWRLLYSLNPMVGVIDGFRWALLDSSATLYWPGFLLSSALCLLLFWSGLLFFRRSERQFADVI
ncbi:MAG: ABC transporter permease [Desulfuromonadales bacterium]|nr:ABC transporter permease [Desulfuromonadales bacterium]